MAKKGAQAANQIAWERTYLKVCNHIIFWFPKESVCPITLFELGQWATKENLESGRVLIGWESGYSRGFDINQQLYHVSGKYVNYEKDISALIRDTSIAIMNLSRK